MNRVVRENYSVADLPEDLRAELANVDRVRVVIEPVAASASGKPFSLDELFARARPSFNSFQEVVAHIDTMRDEWD